MERYICVMRDPESDLKQRLGLVVERQQALLTAFNEALQAGDSVKQAAIEPQLRKLSSEMRRLTDERRYVQLVQNVAVPRMRSRATGKTGRELVLDALDEIGVPVSPSTISEFSQATTGVGIPATRFASLRRDEERAARRDFASRPAWVAPALSTARLTPLPRLFTSSAWETERRLVGARSARVNHLRATLAFLERFERLQSADPSQSSAIENLLIRFARGVPGAAPSGTSLEPQKIRAVVQGELQAIESDDLQERREAAARLTRYGDQQRLWGLPSVIEGRSQSERVGR